MERLEQSLSESISNYPFEMQGLHAYDQMEKCLAEHSGLISLPHSHLDPTHFPVDFKGAVTM